MPFCRVRIAVEVGHVWVRPRHPVVRQQEDWQMLNCRGPIVAIPPHIHFGSSEPTSITDKHREALVNKIVALRPSLRDFVRETSGNMLSGSWDLVSYSFQWDFKTMLNLARADLTGQLHLPLLSLWRQSLELAIKSMIVELAGTISGNPGYNLQRLFQQLLDNRAADGYSDDDDLARNVRVMIDQVQEFDPFADRFRYPADRGEKPYGGIAIDLNELFQAHWIFTTW